MGNSENLNKSIRAFKLIRGLQDKIKDFRSETLLQLFNRYQKIRTPELSSEILISRTYNGNWKNIFEVEKNLLKGSLNTNNISHIEHIGSTSIINQSSNNVIDIALTLASWEIRDIEDILGKLGYIFYGNSPLSKDAVWFWKIDEKSDNAFVLHVDNEENLWLQDTLNFRDFLSSHEKELLEYNNLKQNMATLKKEDILLYSLRKIELTYTITLKANKWRHSQPAF